MTAINDIPIVEPITGNKRHTYYGAQQPSAPSPLPPPASVSKDSDKQPLLGSTSSESKPLVSENLIMLEDERVEEEPQPLIQVESPDSDHAEQPLPEPTLITSSRVETTTYR